MYDVSLPHFEGPMDLLLFFVQRDELDIYDIPIARLTEDFLAYTRRLTEIDLDGAGEFIYFAAVLIGIKARTLLPARGDGEEDEVVDPRRELAERLMEYVRFKEAAAVLREAEAERSEHATRPVIAHQALPTPSSGEVALSLSRLDLIRALRRVLTRLPEPVVHTVRRVRVTVAEALALLRSRLAGQRRMSFASFVEARPRAFVVASLLGVLEWARAGHLRLAPGVGDDFLVEAASADLPVPAATEPSPP